MTMFLLHAQNTVQNQWTQANAIVLDKTQGFFVGEKLFTVKMLMQVCGVSLQALFGSQCVFRLSASKTVEGKVLLCYDACGSILNDTRDLGTGFWLYFFQV